MEEVKRHHHVTAAAVVLRATVAMVAVAAGKATEVTDVAEAVRAGRNLQKAAENIMITVWCNAIIVSSLGITNQSVTSHDVSIVASSFTIQWRRMKNIFKVG